MPSSSRSRIRRRKKISKEKALLTDATNLEPEKTLFARFRGMALVICKLRARYNLLDSPDLPQIPKKIRGYMNPRIVALILAEVVPGDVTITDQVMEDMCDVFIQNERKVLATVSQSGLHTWRTNGGGDADLLSLSSLDSDSDEDKDDRVKMLLVNNDGSGEPASTQMESYDYCSGETQWCFSQVKGALDDDVTEADIISCVEFNDDGDYLATGDKGGRVVIFQRDPISKNCIPRRGEYNVYSTFQSHEPEFDYLKSLEIEEKINKIRWLRRKNPAHFLLSTNDKTIKLWKVAEKEWRVEGFNLKEDGSYRDSNFITKLQVPAVKPSPLTIEASVRRVFANAHTYHINSISLNSDQETYLSADDLRVNLWNLEINDQSFNIVDIKPTNMEELTEVITAAEFHPASCNVFVYSSSKGTIRLCDMRQNALCDTHSKLFDEPEDPTNRSFFSEIISSISDVKFSYSGRYMVSRDYLTVKVWDLHMEARPVECYPVHEYLRAKLCSLYENDCIFDKFECCWNGTDSAIMTGSYNNFFRTFDRSLKKDYTLEASREVAKPKTILKPRKVGMGGKRKKDEIGVDCLDFSKKILHTAWHPKENIIAVAATNNLFLFQDKC